MKSRLFPLAAGLLVAAVLHAAPAVRKDPSDLYLNAYFQVQEAEKSERSNDRGTAYSQFQAALELLEQIRKDSPDWRPDLVNFRTTYCKTKISSLKGAGIAGKSQPAPTPAPEPAPVEPAKPVQTAKVTPPAPAKPPVVAETKPVKPAKPEVKPEKPTKPTLAAVDTPKPKPSVKPVTEPDLPEGGPDVSLPQVTLPSGATATETVRLFQRRINELTEDNKRLKRDLAAANAQLEALGSSGNVDRSLAAMRSQVEATKEQLDLARMQIDSYEKTTTELKSRLKEVQNSYNLAQARALQPGDAGLLQQENELLRSIITRQLDAQAKREDTKKALAAELQGLQVKSETLPRLIEHLGAPLVELSAPELAMLKSPRVGLSSVAAVAATTPGLTPSAITAAVDEAAAGDGTAKPASPEFAMPNDRMSIPAVMRSVGADAAAYFEQRQFEKAGEKYREILKQYPDNVYCLANYGVVLFQMGQLKEAEEVLTKACRLAPQDSFSHANLGIVYYAMKRFDEAVATLTRASSLDPRDPQTHNYLGISCSQKGWQTVAEQELLKAVELNPNYADAHFNLAVIYATQKPPSKELARKHYRAATMLGIPKDPELEKLMDLTPATSANDGPAPALTPVSLGQ